MEGGGGPPTNKFGKRPIYFFEGFPKRWVLVDDGYLGGDICVGDLEGSGILVVILRLF